MINTQNPGDIIMIHVDRLNIKPLVFIFIIGLITGTPALQAQDFEEFMRQQQEGVEQMEQAHRAGIMESVEAWEAFQEREKAAFESYKEEMERLWGDFKERTSKDWVEYRRDGRVRASVDFETGEGSVEIIAETPEEVEAARELIKEELIETFTDKGNEREFAIGNEDLRPISDEPILSGQIAGTVEEAAEEMVQQVQAKEVVGEDGIARSVVFVNFALAPDHLQTRARKVQHYVYQFAEEYEIDPSLIFAIIHTESYYNPAAKSFANALGLMQLVPSTGGRDAFRAVYKEDGVPSQEYLFIPENNVRLGTAYIDILWSNYFRGVDDPLVRELLIISAYNTGAGNVARAYTGNTNLRRALEDINKLDPEETFDHLVINLPYDETRDYLQKVTQRREMYRSWADEHK